MRVVVGLLGATLCAPTVGAQTLERFEFEHGAMGTAFRIALYATDADHAERAASAAFQRIDEIDEALSDYKPTSEISRLSKTAGSGQWVSVGGDLWAVLVRSKGLSVETGGAFDIRAPRLRARSDCKLCQYVRFSYGPPLSTLKTGLDRLKKLLC